MKTYIVTLEIKKYVTFPIDSPNNIRDIEETARCRAIGEGYDPDYIVSIIEQSLVRKEGERV